jgi:hypothetical protein
MTVLQLRHENVSKFAVCSSDLLLIIASPQSGQCRIGGRSGANAVVPGGVARDFAPSCAATVAALLEDVRRLFPQLVELDDNTAWLQDRTATTGILRSELARQFGAGGYVGRASGRASIRARCSPIRKILSTLCRRKCSLKRTETPTQSVRAFHSKT